MSRRSGQNPQPVVHRGWWTVRYWIDVPGQDKRMRIRAKICPTSGPGLLTKSAIQRRASEIIQESGADAVEHFEKCIASTLGETFRQRADQWMIEVTTKENPIAVATAISYKSCLNKWLNPNLGDLPLRSIYADTVRDILSPKFAANLAPKSRHGIVAVLQLIVASVKDKHGEPVHKRTWNHDFMGLPEVKYQHRPKLTAEQVSAVIEASAGRYRVLGALLAGTGMRIGEALATRLEPYSEDHTTISPDFKTIHVRKSVFRSAEQKPKTENAIRSVDICDALAAILKEFVGTRTTGFLFRSRSRGLPLLQANILGSWLHKHNVNGFHTFRRFRTAHLRKCRVPWDLEKLWIGHANKDVTDRYAEQLEEDVAYRQEWANKIALGFTLGPSNVVSIKDHQAA